MVATATLIQNSSIEICALPYPYRGVLKGLQKILLSASPAACIAALGGSAAAAALVVTEVLSDGPYDDAAYGGGVTSPGDIDIPLPTGRIPYGNLAGDGLSSEAALAYNPATNTLTAGALATGAVTSSALTAGRVPYAGAAGLLKDEAALAYNEGTDTLTAGVLATGAAGSVAAGTAGISTTGDLVAAGGFRSPVGPFSQTAAAAQTDTEFNYSGVNAAAFIAYAAGSIVGISAQLDVAPTVDPITVTVLINGAPVPAGIVFSVGGGVINSNTFAKDAIPFAANDTIQLAYTVGAALGNTPVMVGNIQIEC